MLEATKCAKGDDHDAATKGMNYNYLVARNSLIHIGAFSKKDVYTWEWNKTST